MKKYFLILILPLIVLHLKAQNGTITFHVRNAETYFGLKASIFTTINAKTTTFLSDESGNYVFTSRAGKYHFFFYNHAAKTIATDLTVIANTNITVDVLMNPTTSSLPHHQLNNASFNKQIKGYVSDYVTGKPLGNTKIWIDNKVVAITNEKGYYSFSTMPFIHQSNTKNTRKDIVFTHKNYATYVKQNVFLDKGRLTLKIQLKQEKDTTLSPMFLGFYDRTHNDLMAYEKNNIVPLKASTNTAQQGCSIPPSIKVGINCSCTTCSTIQVMSLDYYTESGLDEEWDPNWLPASLAAGSIPYRSYGAWYVNNPVNINYDISSSTCNQVWDGTTVRASSQQAAQTTQGIVLTANGLTPAKSEYSQENNYGGISYYCSNCYAGGNGAYACFSDSVCCGATPAGHGRGMCQAGSQRWAQAGKNYQWIVNHYYINTIGYTLCAQNIPINLTITPMGCPHDGVIFSWQNTGSNWVLDVSTDSTFTNFWSKSIANASNVTAPGSFCLNGSICNSADYLRFTRQTKYFWRINDGVNFYYGNSFITPNCFTIDTACVGTYNDTGGATNSYTGNEDYTLQIAPNNSNMVTINFTSFDIEQNFDSLWIYDGVETQANLLGVYTGTNSPNTLNATSGIITIRFKSDPLVNHSGWEATWSCNLATQINDIFKNVIITTYPNPVKEKMLLATSGNYKFVAIKIFNVYGQQVYFNAKLGNANKVNINLNKLSSGVYLYQLKIKKQGALKTMIGKFVKQ